MKEYDNLLSNVKEDENLIFLCLCKYGTYVDWSAGQLPSEIMYVPKGAFETAAKSFIDAVDHKYDNLMHISNDYLTTFASYLETPKEDMKNMPVNAQAIVPSVLSFINHAQSMERTHYLYIDDA